MGGRGQGKEGRRGDSFSGLLGSEVGDLAYGAFPVSWLQRMHRLLVTEDATEAEIPKKMCLKGILKGFKLSVARLWLTGNHHVY